MFVTDADAVSTYVTRSQRFFLIAYKGLGHFGICGPITRRFYGTASSLSFQPLKRFPLQLLFFLTVVRPDRQGPFWRAGFGS